MATEYPEWVEKIRARYGEKKFFTFKETMLILECGRDCVYARLADGTLQAHNPNGRPGRNGTRIIGESIWLLLRDGVIHPEKWA